MFTKTWHKLPTTPLFCLCTQFTKLCVQTVCNTRCLTLLHSWPLLPRSVIRWCNETNPDVGQLLCSWDRWAHDEPNAPTRWGVYAYIYIYICTYTYIHKSTMVWYSYSPKRLWTPVELPTASIQTDRWTHHLWLNGSGSHLHGSRGQQTRPSYVPCIDYLYLYIYIYIQMYVCIWLIQLPV
jgi:hypothetical protein